MTPLEDASVYAALSGFGVNFAGKHGGRSRCVAMAIRVKHKTIDEEHVRVGVCVCVCARTWPDTFRPQV